MIRTAVQKIISRLDQDLPNDQAHVLMSPVGLGHYREIQHPYKEAAVLTLIYPKNGESHILFMKRTSHHPGDKHAGQISFPGGKKDAEDTDLLACVRRETREEVGLQSDQYEILGQLSQLYVYVSNFLVHPFIAYTDKTLSFYPEESEVERIIEFPLKHFLYFKNKKRRDIQVRNIKMKEVPYFELGNEVLWGATAMIMSELVVILEELKIEENQLKYT